ncbi:homoserine dehydrogenase [Neokomagataea thailandica NBRC 106555]|uniref:Homoserine dehydrogenase n=2 Tax=Neokomagataea TaxID=1223423 RepID=A0A4Y6V3N9_9PROT|nr:MULTISPECIES: homoserine dehydrogenase [Neokomagataea]QDH24679.1 homoserine dehydrogenase [Neokomagataea tanensis]GBR53855.1 homoserine dehydrogenase [Neokomagataea thailandica NBRC 106555]
MKPLRIGLAGLGTVGVGVIKLLRAHAEELSARGGRPVEVVAVSARSRDRDRGISLDGLRWHDDPVSLAQDTEIDVAVELIGGSEGPARLMVEAALGRGIPVVTANKALVALHGSALARLAADNNTTLLFEAAVAGGIPAIKLVREGLAAERLDRVGGILNGTCNYILTEMRTSGRDFSDVLAEAQEKGYAEAEPSTDVDGWDAAHKLAILAGIAFNPIRFESLPVEGIRNVTAADLRFATELGYRIKLLGLARQHEGKALEAWVRPCMVPVVAPIAGVEGVFNAVTTSGPFSGPITISGRGAGEGPTASAVVADLIDLARGASLPVWGVGAVSDAVECGSLADVESAFYIRLDVADRSGTMADLTSVLRDHDVSVHFVSQHEAASGRAYVALVTHGVAESAVREAAKGLAALPAVNGEPLVLKIEDSLR